MMNLLWHELRMRRWSTLGWTLGFSFFSVIYMLVFTALPDEVRLIDPSTLSFLKSIGVQSFTAFEGFILGTEFNVLPLIVGVYGVFVGIGTLVKQEDEGLLELLIALPISRIQLLWAKVLATALATVAALVMTGLIAMGVFALLSIDTTVTALDLFWVIQSHWLIGFFFFSLSLFLGAFLPHRTAAGSVAAAILLVSFFGERLAGVAPSVLEPYQPYFPFYYFKHVVEMLAGDVAWSDIAILWVATFGFLMLAMIFFQRRNITVGAWPWQRPRLPR